MNIWIAGRRYYTNELFVLDALSKNLNPFDTVRTGGARGVDTIVEKLVTENQICALEDPILPDYEKHAQYATFVRNAQGVDWADRVLVFWDHHKRGGTWHVVKEAMKMKRPLTIVDIRPVQERKKHKF